jgi:hypothetical protein
MKTFVRLVPAFRHPGRFFCPRAPKGAGIHLFPNGLGCAWWKPSPQINPDLLLQLPPALASLVFATLTTGRLSLWIKFPWRTPRKNSLLLIVSVRREDGSFLNLGWSPQVRTRSDAVAFLTACTALDGAWIDDDQAFLDQRHGRLVAVENYTHGLPLLPSARAAA